MANKCYPYHCTRHIGSYPNSPDGYFAIHESFNACSTLDRNDKWDQVVGACGAGAFLNRAKGPSGMAQGAATYGLFSLIFAVQSKEDPLDVVDIPVDALAQKR